MLFRSGDGRGLSPAIDAVARQGTAFRGSGQSSWTKPSIATILTSLYASSHMAMSKAAVLPDSVTTVAEALRDAGYTTVTASSGHEALEAAKKLAPLGALVTDMMMPVLNGKKAIQAMSQIRPDMRFISISGLGQPDDFESGPNAPRVETLSKPFTTEKILETVARVVA